jgi:hypothetical protein
MGCDEIREILPLYAGREVRENERVAVEAHLALCVACACELEQYREAMSGLALLREGEVPEETWASLWKRVASELFPWRASPVRALGRPALHYAAVLLIGLGVGGLFHLSLRRPGPEPAVRETSAVQPFVPVRAGAVDRGPSLRLDPRPAIPRSASGVYHLRRVERVPATVEKDF